MLGYARPDRACLPNVHSHAPVESEYPVEVDPGTWVFEIPAYSFERVEGPAVGEESPDLGPDAAHTQIWEVGVSGYPCSISLRMSRTWVLKFL